RIGLFPETLHDSLEGRLMVAEIAQQPLHSGFLGFVRAVGQALRQTVVQRPRPLDQVFERLNLHPKTHLAPSRNPSRLHRAPTIRGPPDPPGGFPAFRLMLTLASPEALKV